MYTFDKTYSQRTVLNLSSSRRSDYRRAILVCNSVYYYYSTQFVLLYMYFYYGESVKNIGFLLDTLSYFQLPPNPHKYNFAFVKDLSLLP